MTGKAWRGGVLGAVMLLGLGGCGKSGDAESTTLGVAGQAAESVPDFAITSVKGPASVTPGQQFTATVTVCNQGSMGDSTEVELYLSSDALISSTKPPDPAADQPLGYLSINYLSPGQCQTLTHSVSAWVPSEGAWYLGAVVDPGNFRPEAREDNNALAGTRMGIGHNPDFVVTSVKGPASTMPGQQFTAKVTVCNQGTQGGSTEAELYLSADATITPTNSPDPSTDQPVGYLPIHYLNPGQCQTLTQSVSAWVPSEGAWYVGAAVDPGNYRPELIDDNNTLAGTLMGVGHRPDFVVTTVKGPASVMPGQQFNATVTVCNQGTQADSTQVELYLSSDATITPTNSPDPSTDQPLGYVYGNYLEPGQCRTLTQSFSAWVPSSGPWYLGAVADPVNSRPELIEDNNTLAGTRVGIGNNPDFVVTSVTGPASVRHNDPFTATVTVCNQGTVGDSTEVELYLSKDATITPTMMPDPSTDQPLGFLPVNYLNPGQCQTLTRSLNAWVPSEGAWYVGAVADPSNFRPELIDDNNTLAGTRMGVGHNPDFVVTSVTGPTSVTPGQQFNVTVTVCNQGTRGDSTDVELYLSKDDIITPTYMPDPSTDQPLGFLPVNHLDAGQCQTLTQSVSAWAPSEGAWYLGAAIDPGGYRPELIDDNNTLAGTRIGVGHNPDFVVTSVTGPASTMPGQQFNATVTVCNQGTLGGSTEVELYLSSDATITPPMPPGPTTDQPLGRIPPTNLLYPGQCQTLSMPVKAYAPSEGAWYLGAAVDPSNNRPEFLEDNNTLAGTRMGVGHRPDFIVTAVKGPASVTPGQQFNAMVTVCNQGTLADSTQVELYLSSDATITPTYMPDPSTDQPVGFFHVNYLNPGQCQTLTQSVSAWVPSEGAWYLGAAADPVNGRPELIEDNNTLAGTRMGIGNKPDFVVTSVTGPASVKPDRQFTATVTVCNQGTQADSTEVELYLSKDATITPMMWTSPNPNADLPLLRSPTHHLNPGQCQTLTQSVSALVPSEGAWYVGAAVDPENYRPELIEDNNTLAGTRMGVGYLSDIVVTSVTGPASVKPGQSFDATVTVCNQGTMGDSTDVQLYLSKDATITPTMMPDPSTDQPLDFLVINYLGAGQCQTLTKSVSAWVPSEGAWYVGAVADPGNFRPELIEDNNTLAGTRIGVGQKSDIIVTSVKGPTSVLPGQQFNATVTVCNQGTLADATDVELYLSKDDIITPTYMPDPSTDQPLGFLPVGHLNPGQCQTLAMPVSTWVPSEGAWYLGAVADPGNFRPELIEDNNTLAGTRMGIGNRPDFIVTSVVGPSSVRLGQPFNATVTVCNQGTQREFTDVHVYLSSDATITPTMTPEPTSDQPVGFFHVEDLDPGQCQTVTQSVNAWVPSSGAWYLGAATNPSGYHPELIEDNNTRAGTILSVTP